MDGRRPRGAEDLEREVGNPLARWEALKERVQAEVTTFADIANDWVDLMWAMDAYRVAQVMPRWHGPG